MVNIYTRFGFLVWSPSYTPHFSVTWYVGWTSNQVESQIGSKHLILYHLYVSVYYIYSIMISVWLPYLKCMTLPFVMCSIFKQCWSVKYMCFFSLFSVHIWLPWFLREFDGISKNLSLKYLNIRIQDHNIGLFCSHISVCRTLHTYFLDIS